MRLPRLAMSCATVACVALLAACATGTAQDPEATMQQIGKEYVELVLAVGLHDSGYVDAYYGPEQWRERVEAEAPSLAVIEERAGALAERLGPIAERGLEELSVLRKRYLESQLGALRARVAMLGGKKMSFDEESRALYDAEAPTREDAYYQGLIDELEPLLPGSGSLIERYERFKRDFVIPADRLDTVFRTAVDACRERTAQFIELPEEENFEIEYVTDKPWSGYNWYQGKFHSLIQVNTDLPIYIDRAIDLACHEGYPGHHVYNAMLEKTLVVGKEWPEFSVYPLYSPQSLIAEGTANFGIEVAFPGDERVVFERETLFPLAGLDPAKADLYYEVEGKTQALNYAGNEAARRYLNGEIDARQAAEHLTRYALMPPARAEQRVRFIDSYRSYVINYNLGEDLVRAYIESRGGTADDPEKRWAVFAELLSSPRLPSGLSRP